MKAMVLAAGLGTRLRPLTDNRPKALVEMAGRTLLEITLARLRAFGTSEVIINVHHFADMVIEYLKINKNFGMRIDISREDVLLDTGGGLKKAAWFFLEDPNRLDEPFLLHNVDVVSTIDFARMLRFHKKNRALATLAVQAREASRYLLFDDHLQLSGRDQKPELVRGHLTSIPRQGTASAVPKSEKYSGALAPEVKSSQPFLSLAFSGIHIISPRLLPMLTEEGVFSIIPSYLRLATRGENILAFRADEYYWRDLGRPDDLTQAAHDLQQNVLR
jgi:NDP-sugar pyrophosphorylase family protein